MKGYMYIFEYKDKLRNLLGFRMAQELCHKSVERSANDVGYSFEYYFTHRKPSTFVFNEDGAVKKTMDEIGYYCLGPGISKVAENGIMDADALYQDLIRQMLAAIDSGEAITKYKLLDTHDDVFYRQRIHELAKAVK